MRKSVLLGALTGCLWIPSVSGQQGINVDPATGNVGIGTQAPQATLDVRGTGAGEQPPTVLLQRDVHFFPGIGLPPLSPGVGSGSIRPLQPSRARAELRLRAHSERIEIAPIGGTAPPPAVTEGTGRVAVDADQATGQRKFTLGSSDAGMPITFETRGAERLRIDDTGKIGVGTPNPQTQLDVAGNIAVMGRP